MNFTTLGESEPFSIRRNILTKASCFRIKDEQIYIQADSLFEILRMTRNALVLFLMAYKGIA